MSSAIQRRRGTTVDHSTFTGLVGELTVNTDTKTLVIHDGVTVGGNPQASIAQVQAQAGTAFTTAGTAPNFTLTPSPSVAALVAGLRFRASFNAAGTLGSNTLNVSAQGAKNIMQFDALGSLVPANITSGLLSDVEYNGTQWVLLDPVAAKVSVAGSMRNDKMSVTSAGASATFTADEVIVETALGGMAYQLPSFSKTINLATTGAGGMDTGTAPVSGFVALYAIYNPTTNVSALLAANATAAAAPVIYGGANMPSGYTASALVSVWPTNGSSQFIMAFQMNSVVRIPQVQVSTNLTATTYQAISLSAAVPKNAKAVLGYFRYISSASNAGGGFLAAASDALATGAIYTGIGGVTGLAVYSSFEVSIPTAQTMYMGGNDGTVTSNDTHITGYRL